MRIFRAWTGCDRRLRSSVCLTAVSGILTGFLAGFLATLSVASAQTPKPPTILAPTAAATPMLASAVCLGELRKFLDATVRQVQAAPADPVDRYVPALRSATRSCDTPQTAKPVCTLALTEAVKALATEARAAKDKPLSAEQANAQLQSITQHIDFCRSPSQIDELCRRDIDIATFREWQRQTAAPGTPATSLKDVCKPYLDRQAALTALVAAQSDFNIQQEVCAYKERRLPSLLRDLYQRRDGEDGDDDNQLSIDEVRYGDLKHGHTCDATKHVVRRCAGLFGIVPTSVGDSTEAAAASFCLLKRTTPTSRVDLCGFDPSPQADLTIKVKYSCRNGATKSKTLLLPWDTTRIDVVCALPSDPRAIRIPETAALDKEILFFRAAPCRIAVDGKPLP